MTAFETAIPLITLAVAGIGALALRCEAHKLADRIAARREARHPAQ